MSKGFLAVVLHAHLPFVRHPEHRRFFEENWLFEAVTECYIPLLGCLDRLAADGVGFRLTLSLSPPLLTMLRDELLQNRYLNYLKSRIDLSASEKKRTRNQPDMHRLACFYHDFFSETLQAYTVRYKGDLVRAFVNHHRQGRLELMTSAATHGFLPLLAVNPAAVRSQITVGVEAFRQFTGIEPAGFWLPECGYYPGLEAVLKDAGARYFFTDSHAILNATAQPEQGVYAPLDCGNGVAAFGRDPESSEQVWSARQGYPGDFDYRDYYRDIGFDLDASYLAPYLPDPETRSPTGLKYYRITGIDTEKQLYDPVKARLKAERHARDFIARRCARIARLNADNGRPPIIVAPYDAELFGHWWFEGPHWLEAVFRQAAAHADMIETKSCSDYLALHPGPQIATPSASSWGENGYFSYWINASNDWIYPYIHQAGQQLQSLIAELKGLSVNDVQTRTLNQAVRSLLLAQASDWPFILKSGTTVDYAAKRLKDALARFNYLYDGITKGKIDERYLTALELMDNIFPEINFRGYCE